MKFIAIHEIQYLIYVKDSKVTKCLALCLFLNRRWRAISIFLDERLKVLSLDYARAQNVSKASIAFKALMFRYSFIIFKKIYFFFFFELTVCPVTTVNIVTRNVHR